MVFIYLMGVLAILLLAVSIRNVHGRSTSIFDAEWLVEEEKFRFAARWGRGF